MPLKKAFTLFIYVLMVAFIFLGPGLLVNIKDNLDMSAEPQKVEQPWTGVISLWDYPRLDHRTGLQFGWIKSKIKEFEKLHPGVYIELRELDRQEGPTLLKAASTIGGCPDIAPVGAEYYYISRGVLEPLDQWLDPGEAADFVDDAKIAVTYGGQIYGIPWMMTGYTLLLNTDMFQERQVPLPQDRNWTYAQFVDALKKLTYDNNGRGGPDVYGFGGFLEPGKYNMYGLLMCDGWRIIDENTGKINSKDPAAKQGVLNLVNMTQSGVTLPSPDKLSAFQAWTAFQGGKAAVYPAESWQVARLKSMEEGQGFNFTTANFPSGVSGRPFNGYENICAYSVFKQKDEGKKAMCMAFIKFLTSAEKQGELVRFGYFSPRKSGKSLYENDKEMYTIQQSLNFSTVLPRVADWDDTDLMLQSRLKSALTGEMTPEQALDETARNMKNREN